MNILIILFSVILVLGLLVLVFYNYLEVRGIEDRKVLIQGDRKIEQEYAQTIPITDVFDVDSRDNMTLDGIPEGRGLTFKWSMKIPSFIPERTWFTSYGKYKPIVRILDSPCIFYHPKTNSLLVQVKYKKTDFLTKYPVIELKDIPLQRWNNFVVVIKTNQVKVFMNGDLLILKSLPNPIIFNNSDIIIGEVNNNIIGNIRNLEVIFKPLTNVQVKQELLFN